MGAGMAAQISLRLRGAFSLARSVAVAARSAFVDPLREDCGTQALDLAFPMDGSWHPLGVRVVQDADGLRAVVLANPSQAAEPTIRSEVERVLCLDLDGEAFARIGEVDPVVADLQQRFAGLRPILFPSPYQAAARAIIGHRLAAPAAAVAARRIVEQHGQRLQMGDRAVHAFPSPQRLAEIEPVRGLSERKIDQLRTLGEAASAGGLSTPALREAGYDQARTELERLPGIGPFSSELVMARGVGEIDAFPRTELSFQRAMATAHHLRDGDVEAMEAIAQRWRPYRSWVALLLRTAARES